MSKKFHDNINFVEKHSFKNIDDANEASDHIHLCLSDKDIDKYFIESCLSDLVILITRQKHHEHLNREFSYTGSEYMEINVRLRQESRHESLNQ